MCKIDEDKRRFEALLSDFFRAGPRDEEDDDMFDGDEPEGEEGDRQAWQRDHARDHRKHA